MQKESFPTEWKAEHLRGGRAGRVHVTQSKEDLESFRAAVSDEALGLFELDGNRARSKGDLLDQLADVMSFASYFGNNWDAFEECVNDLSWKSAPGYVLIILDAFSLVQHLPEEARTAIWILVLAVRNWWGRGISFHLVLTGEARALQGTIDSIAPDSPVILCMHVDRVAP
jgi:hypothetical protein